ncbi:MAG: hypothetical protein IPJ81_16095 [Chitinophagaceae bacterium]|nr:hypothetical protein [Chitinophagaceae bacterium]
MATDFKDLIKLIQSAVDKFNTQIPGIQKSLLDNIRMQLKEVDTKGNNIAINTKNVRLIAQIKSKLEKIMLTPEYKRSVKQFVTTFEDITKFQNSYFEQLEEKFKPSKLGAEIKKQAMQAVVEKLTENGLSANVTAGIEDLLRKILPVARHIVHWRIICKIILLIMKPAKGNYRNIPNKLLPMLLINIVDNTHKL